MSETINSHETSNNSSPSAWEKMAANAPSFKEQPNTNSQEFVCEAENTKKEEQLENLRNKVNEAYDKRDTNNSKNSSELNKSHLENKHEIDSPDISGATVGHNQEYTKNQSKPNFFERLKTAREERKIAKDIDLIQSLADSTEWKKRTKFRKLIDRKYFDFSNDRIANAYLNTRISIDRWSLEDYEKLGISSEVIANNPNVQALTADAFITNVKDILDPEEDPKGHFRTHYDDNPSLDDMPRYSPKILSIALKNDQIKQQILDKIDIQAFGDHSVSAVIDKIGLHKKGNTDVATLNLNNLKALGYEPSKNPNLISSLLNDYDTTVEQEFAKEVGLIDQTTISDMYRYKFDQTMHYASTHPGEKDMPFFSIIESLVPSKDDTFASYWHQQSEALGSDAIKYCISQANIFLKDEHDKWEKHRDDQQPEPALSDYVKDGKLEKAFFSHQAFKSLVFNYDYYDEHAINFLLNNLDQLDNEYKGFIKTWGEINVTEDETATSKARHEFFKYAASGRQLPDYFDSTGPTEKFYADTLRHHYGNHFISSMQNNWADHYTPSEKSFLLYMGKTDADEFYSAINGDPASYIETFFDEHGPKSEFWQSQFWQDKFNGGAFSFICNQGKDCIAKMPLNDKQACAIDVYKELDDSTIKQLFRDFIIKNHENVPLSQIENIPKLFSRITSSNADEIITCRDNIAIQLLNSGSFEKMTENLAKIENIFIHNNLPYVGKVFKTFSILHPAEQYASRNDASTSTADRGVLKNLPNQGLRSREAVLWNDLLKATIGSNNRSLIKYLSELEDPNHLKTLAENTQQGREVNGEYDAINAFASSSRYSTADRIVRSFAFGLGYKTYEELKHAVDEIPKQAHERNLKRLEDNDFSLQKGDLIKAIDLEYLGNILQNGAVSKEFLNGQAESDSTPLDADLGILEEDFDTISDGIDHKNKTNSFGTMHCLLIMKGDESTGRNRFQHENDGVYDPNKYEIWDNGGENHGIRVGFPSSEIDFIVYDSFGNQDTYADLNRIKFEVARNGFFIPIVDKISGKPVFTEEEYNSLRDKMSGLSEYGLSEYHFANDEDLNFDGINQITSQLDNTEQVVRQKHAAIDHAIDRALATLGDLSPTGSLTRRNELTGDLTEGIIELLDTGSTGRYDNAPTGYDFDYMVKLDRSIISDPEKLDRLRSAISAELPGIDHTTTSKGDFRYKGITIPDSPDPLEIDISFEQKTNKVQYSTDAALTDRLNNIRAQDPEKAKQIVANIVYAKQLLKESKAYKPARSDKEQGGLGGAGVENWILQNGGSLKVAAREFLAAAEAAERAAAERAVAEAAGTSQEQDLSEIEFANFCSTYSVFDFGENHMASGKTFTHDNFVTNNMSADGYQRMKTTLRTFLAQQP